MGNSNSGRGGLPREKRREVERLIRAGHKNAHIARDCGIDVSTVSRYKRRMRREAEAQNDEARTGVGAEEVRCGGCGGQIVVSPTMQCLKCLLEKTAFADARQRRIERLARLRGRRSQKARIAA